MQKVVRIAAFTSILLVTIAAVIGEQTSSIEPTVPYEALTISPGKVEGTKKQSVTPLPLRADLQQITKNKQTPEVRSQYRRQKAKDDARGINNLGKMLLNGVDRDLVEAFNLFTLAARAGDAEAINNLGQMYEMGWGTPADTKTAIELYAKALRKGSSAARKNFRRLTHAAAISDREVVGPPGSGRRPQAPTVRYYPAHWHADLANHKPDRGICLEQPASCPGQHRRYLHRFKTGRSKG